MLSIQKHILDHLLHPVVMKRITDTALYGNRYSLSSMMGDLTDAIFKADARSDVNSMRQNLQVEYVRRLAKMIRNGYDSHSRSMAIYTLNVIDDLLGRKRGTNVSTQAHTQHLKLVIDRALDTSA